MSLASAIMLSYSFHRIAETTGPKISSCAIRILFRTSPKTTGVTKNPLERDGSAGRVPPHRRVAPSFFPISMYERTFSICSLETIAPSWVSSFIGSPTLSPLTLATSFPMKLS